MIFRHQNETLTFDSSIIEICDICLDTIESSQDCKIMVNKSTGEEFRVCSNCHGYRFKLLESPILNLKRYAKKVELENNGLVEVAPRKIHA